ncbi:MAG: AtpZ/AtpI family protein [Acidobacteriota bacterium]|nr:AtpZ/AtpI family protein [Acidobacteriota bacterium]
MPENDEQEVTRKSGMAYAAGLSIFISVATLMGLGWLLDGWLKTDPWLMVAGIILGSVVGFYQFLRVVSKMN